MKSERSSRDTQPSVSVVIPTYNHARFVSDAIESVLAQSGGDDEIVVVDDGSTDDTAEVVKRYPAVTYVYQPNAGLSAARNTGIKRSHGLYLVFLDADDRLLPGALQSGIACLEEHPEAGFVSGRHIRVTTSGEPIQRHENEQPHTDHFLALLRGNYIGMHAAVMYRRECFESVGNFDVGLPACEDYDLYLRIAREIPVACHAAVVAEYRIHDTNMSSDIGLMLGTVLRVLRRQRPHVEGDARRERALREGITIWREYYVEELLAQRSSASARPSAWKAIATLGRHAPRQAAGVVLQRSRRKARLAARRVVPEVIRCRLREATRVGETVPPLGRVRFGDLRRLTPISRRFGYDRGFPIDRHYIEAFLGRHADCVRGRVLEIGDNDYTIQFGGDRVTQSDVLHAHEGNPAATFVGDLAQGDHLPGDAFDCVVLTQTLHLIYDLRAAVRTLHRILKPGGMLMATVPGISQIEDGVWANVWHWGLTELSARRLLEEAFAPELIDIESHGNVLASIAFLQGLAAEELTTAELEHHDPLYPLLITLCATKARR